MRGLLMIAVSAVALGGCSREPVPDENISQRGEHPERLAHPAPGEPVIEEGPITPAERDDSGQGQLDASAAGTPSEAATAVATQFGRLLEQREFSKARALFASNGAASGLSEEAFARQFDDIATIRAATEYPKRAETAGDASRAEVQLTLHGNLSSGEPFVRTGLVTLTRSAEADGGWAISRVRLGPSGERLVDQ